MRATAMLRKIGIHVAKQMFEEGQVFLACPHKMRPEGPFSMASIIHSKEWIEEAERYKDNPKMWEGSAVATAWSMMINEWKHYNASSEGGYYPAYYVEA